MKIGDFVFIGEDTVVEAASIGNHVTIGRNCVIGRFSIIKEGVWIQDNTVIPPHSVVVNYSVMKGHPAVFVKELPECIRDVYEDEHVRYYQSYINALAKS